MFAPSIYDLSSESLSHMLLRIASYVVLVLQRLCRKGLGLHALDANMQ